MRIETEWSPHARRPRSEGPQSYRVPLPGRIHGSPSPETTAPDPERPGWFADGQASRMTVSDRAPAPDLALDYLRTLAAGTGLAVDEPRWDLALTRDQARPGPGPRRLR
jgi:hypothetical protein